MLCWRHCRRQSNVLVLTLALTCLWLLLWLETNSKTHVLLRAMTAAQREYSLALRSAFVNNHSNNNYDIRRWGCAARNETPFIFVHIGKAGGGSVRARFAAAAVGYRRGKRWKSNEDRRAYYRLGGGHHGTHHPRAYFCDSAFKHGRLNASTKTFEGTRPCAATTPLGIAVACPQPVEHFHKCLACDIGDINCHRLYTGHNLLGNELHWLPPRYLLHWWKKQTKPKSTSSNNNNNNNTQQIHAELTKALQLIKPDNTDWCPSLQRARFHDDEELEMIYANCSLPMAERIDQLAWQWNTQTSSAASAQASSVAHWGPLYASLPVLRTTIVRDPFSWLLSKMFWHEHETIHNCTNVTAATAHVHDPAKATRPNHDTRAGWAHRMARIFIIQLCGEDCQIRWDKAAARAELSAQQERALLESFERQADYNLRHAFVVVGRIEDVDGFYDMVSRRVHYLPTLATSERLLGKTVVRQRHASGASEACQQVYREANFRKQMIQASPAIAALYRLYQTALRVNAFQKQESETCTALSDG